MFQWMLIEADIIGLSSIVVHLSTIKFIGDGVFKSHCIYALHNGGNDHILMGSFDRGPLEWKAPWVFNVAYSCWHSFVSWIQDIRLWIDFNRSTSYCEELFRYDRIIKSRNQKKTNYEVPIQVWARSLKVDVKASSRDEIFWIHPRWLGGELESGGGCERESET